jgi:hypothetical protein
VGMCSREQEHRVCISNIVQQVCKHSLCPAASKQWPHTVALQAKPGTPTHL